MTARLRLRVPTILLLIALFVSAFIYHTCTIIHGTVRGLYTFSEQLNRDVNAPPEDLRPFPIEEEIRNEVNSNDLDQVSVPEGDVNNDVEEAEHPNQTSSDSNPGSQIDMSPEHDRRPIMHTFFEPDPKGYCCGMLNSGHELLLIAWEQAWQNRGWDTKVLTLEDAKLHPEFQAYQEKLKKIGLTEYNQKCYWRWFAMAALQDENGGWMSDYDAFPLELDGAQGLELELAKEDQESGVFTSYSNHVPCLIHASREEWDRILHLMLDTLPEDHGRTATDMQSLITIGEEIGVQEAGMIWKDETYRTFGYRRNENEELEVDCNALVGNRVAHLSHRGTTEAWRSKLFPEIPPELGPMNGRGEAARIFMNDYNKQCLGMNVENQDATNLSVTDFL